MSAVGYASMPMLPTFEGITKVLEKELGKPLADAAQKAGSQFESSLVKSAESAAGKVEKARQKEVRAAQDVAKAEKQVENAKFAVEQATAKVEQAELSRERANSKAAAAVRKAEQDLAAVMDNSESSVEDITRAQEKLNDARLGEQQTAIREEAKLERALKGSQDATDKAEKASRDLGDQRARAEGAAKNLTDAEEDLDRAQEDASDSAQTLGERLRSMGDEATEAGEKTGGLGSKIMDGFRKIGTGALLGVGAKIGTTVTSGISTAFSSGFDRLASVEQAELMLGGLGHTTETTAEIMDNAMESVKGTAFGFGEAASMAATFVGAGIPEGEELTRVLSLVGDTAAISGADLNEMGSIWTKVATGGRLSTDEMNQLMDRGLGLLPELQEHYGVTADEARKMVTEGKVSFEEFSEIMEGMVGGSAQSMGDSFSGSAANMRAALGRLGSQLLAPVFDNAPAVFQAIGGAVDKLGEYLSPLIEEWGARLEPIMQRFAEQLGPALESAIEGVAEGLKETVGWIRENEAWLAPLAAGIGGMVAAWGAWTLATKAHTAATVLAGKALTLFDNITRRTVIGAIAAALVGVATAMVYFFTQTESGREMWSKFTSALGDGWDWVMDKIGPGLDWIQEKFTAFTGWISTAWSGLTSLFGEGDYTGALSDAFGIEEDSPIILGFFKVRDAIVGIKDLLIGGDFTGALRNAFGIEEDHPVVVGVLRLRDIFINSFETIRENLGIFIDGIKSYFSGIWDLITGDFEGAKENFAAALGGIKDIFLNILSGIGENIATLLGLGEGGFLDTAISAVRNAFVWMGETISAVWDGIVTVGQWAAAIIGTVVLTPLMLGWNALSATFQFGYENIIRPVIDAFAAAGTWLWENALSPVLTWIGEKWTLMGEILSLGWLWIDENVFALFRAGAQWLSDAFSEAVDWVSAKWSESQALLHAGWLWIDQNVFSVFRAGAQWISDAFATAVDWIAGKWQQGQDLLTAGWLWIDQNVFSVFRAGAQWISDAFATAVDWISDRWSDAQSILHTGWRWIDDNVFAPIGSGLETVKGWFDTGVTAIGNIWDGLRKKLAEPINFVIRTVYTEGIKRVFDGVAEKVGLDSRLPEIKEIGGFAQGTSRVPGARTRHDNVHMISTDGRFSLSLRGKEGVVVPEVVDGIGEKHIDNMNRIGLNEGSRGVARYMEHLGSHANGGYINLAGGHSAVTRSHGDFVGQFFPDMFALTSALRYTDNGHHAHGQATDWQAQDGQFATQMPTPWSKALANAIYTNFGNSAELIHHPLDGWQNLKDGSPLDYGAATNAGHGNHVHWATRSPLRWEDGQIVLDDTGGGFSFNPLDWFSGLWDRITGALPTFNMDGFGDWGKIPGAALSTLGDWVKDWAKEKLSSWGSMLTGGSPGNVENFRPLVEKVLKEKGLPLEWADSTLRRMDQESSGNIRAQNNWDSNAVAGTPSKGLMQVIDPTFAAHKDPGYDDIWDPEANLRASMNYAMSRYGSLPNAYDREGGYHRGGLAGWGQGILHKTAIEPERVLSPEMTKAFDAFVYQYMPELIAAAKGRDIDKMARVAEDFFRPYLDPIVDHLEKVADPASAEGMTARGITQRILDMDVLTYGSTIQAFLDAEQTLIAAREQQASRAGAVTAAEEALAEARAELAALGEAEAGMSVENQQKIADAEQALEEAKTARAEAEGDKQAAAADKVTEAEEKLRQVREDVAAETDADAIKRSEDVEKATDSVTKAENDLVKARQDQVQALDASLYSVLPQLSDGLTAASTEVAGLAAQAAGLGGLAAQAVPALAGFGAQLASAAALAGPAGISINMVLTGLQVAIDLIREVVDLIGRLQDRYFSAVDAGHQAVRDYFASVVEWQELVADQQANVSNLQQQVIRDTMAMEQAQWSLRRAQFDRLVAEREGITATTRAAEALWDYEERARLSAELGLRGLTGAADRLRWMSQDALAAAAGAVEETSEWRALAYEYFAASAAAEANRLSAEMATLEAWRDMQASALQLQRSQEDLVRSTAMLSRMTTSFGLTLQQATVGQEVAAVQQEIAERESNKWSIGSIITRGIGGLLDWDGDGKTFGIQNPFSTIRLAQDQQLQDLYDYRDRLMGMDDAPDMNTGELNDMNNAMFWASLLGLDTSALLAGSPLGDAEMALRMENLLRSLDAIEGERIDLERAIEDLELDIAFAEAIRPLEERLLALDYLAEAFTRRAEAEREENEAIRDALLGEAEVAEAISASLGVTPVEVSNVHNIDLPAHLREPREVNLTVTLPSGKTSYTADEVADILRQQGAALGADTTVTGHTASEVTSTRRARIS